MKPLLARWLCLVTMAVWLGGFTFYSGVVIPVLHDRFDSLDVGAVTQRVTDWLNVLGLVTVVVWGASVRLVDGRRTRWAWVVSLALSGVLLAALAVLHEVMDARLDTGSLDGFYPLHRAYLWLSTVQWLVNVVLLGLAALPVERVSR